MLKERFTAWQEEGFIPSHAIEPGDKTTDLFRERGWTHWHHLFNPRQLLLNGLLSQAISKLEHFPLSVFLLNKTLDYSCKNCTWDLTTDCVIHVFSNQSLKVLWNYGARSIDKLLELYSSEIFTKFQSASANQKTKSANLNDKQNMDLRDAKSFIEQQFPSFELSHESYKERMAGSGQTLTGLGKWWGRKPLVLVRAVLLGCLLPATKDPKRDREIFLKLMTMDRSGLLRRKKKAVASAQVAQTLSTKEQEDFFTQEVSGKWIPRPDLSRERKRELEALLFLRLPYEERLRYCLRPEEIDGPGDEEWAEINAHLGTNASSLPGLVEELGRRRFGRTPLVGDVFCGGGSIPFEAARLGCQVHASDLNPVACLLTWGALKMLSTGAEEAARLAQAEEELKRSVKEQITAWGIERNSRGWSADTFLYCIEAPCPECGWRVPMAPSWVISLKRRIVCTLIPDNETRSFTFKIEEAADEEELKKASKGTVGDQKMHCPHCGSSIAIRTMRGDRKGAKGTENHLRRWEKSDFQPRVDDFYQERLYCIRWVIPPSNPGEKPLRFYAAPTEEDLRREEHVVALLKERFTEEDLRREEHVVALLKERFTAWQEEGFIPSHAIEPGNETTRLFDERGWTHWHHLFNARQLLLNGLLSQAISKLEHFPLSVFLLNKTLDYSCKNCTWDLTTDCVIHVFSNQSLKVLWNYGARSIDKLLELSRFQALAAFPAHTSHAMDARQVDIALDMVITDPPYADAVSYHELSEFFLVWLEPHLKNHFPGWYSDSKRALAIRGNGETFNTSMVACYRNLTEQMPENGIQVIMFTHQDAAVWANLALILWAAGLHVTAAWTIATEPTSSFKTENNLKGTVLLICKKRTSSKAVSLEELPALVKEEVSIHVDQMEGYGFESRDLNSAAYSAVLCVLTSYDHIAGLDVDKELTRPKSSYKDSLVVKLVKEAVVAAKSYRASKICNLENQQPPSVP